jgi:hypothetical protein
MSSPRNETNYRLIANIYYDAVNVSRANGLYDDIVSILSRFRRIRRGIEDPFVKVTDISSRGGATLKKEIQRNEGRGNYEETQNESIGTDDQIYFEMDIITEQTTSNRDQLSTIWDRLAADVDLFISIPSTPIQRDTEITMQVCNHDLNTVLSCAAFKKIINNRIIVNRSFP